VQDKAEEAAVVEQVMGSGAKKTVTVAPLVAALARVVEIVHVAGAAVDSLLFPTIAFGALMPHIVLAQFVAKVAGGAFWAWLISRLGRQTLANER
jgi:hypothetical protein